MPTTEYKDILLLLKGLVIVVDDLSLFFIMELILKEFEGLEIVFDSNNWVNVTQTSKNYNKDLSNFLRTKDFKKYCESVEKLRNVKITELKKVVKGKGKEQGTYLHPFLAISFARWISPDFAVQMDIWMESVLTKRITHLERVNDRQQKEIDKQVEQEHKGKWWMND